MHNKHAWEPWQSRTPGFHLLDKNTWCSHLQIFFSSSFWNFLWFYVYLLPSSKIGFKLKITKIEASTCLLKFRAWRLSMGSRKTVSSLPSLLFNPLDWKSGEDMDVFIFIQKNHSEILPITTPWQFLPAVATVSLPPLPAHRQVLEFSAEWMTFWLVSNHTRSQPSLPQGFFQHSHRQTVGGWGQGRRPHAQGTLSNFLGMDAEDCSMGF